MILINVYFIEMGCAYDFKVDVNAPVFQIAEDIISMITLKEHVTLSKEAGLFLLCSKTKRRALDSAKTLHENGISSEDDLILV